MSSFNLSHTRRRSASLQALGSTQFRRGDASKYLTGGDSSFTCTICWQSQHTSLALNNSTTPSDLGPKLLGTEARIVCKTCWYAVLDLSICWVCGECIVRGDDIVSLGWCFWHRACFGCLICSKKLEAPSPCTVNRHSRKWRSLDGNEDHSESSKNYGIKGRCAGVELQDIPLCGNCGEQTREETDSTVLAKGLDNVSKHDGGLGRNRLDRLSEVVPRRLPRRAKFKGATGFESELERFINHSSAGYNGVPGPNVSEVCYLDQYEHTIPFNGLPNGISEDGSAEIPNPKNVALPKGLYYPDPDVRISQAFKSHDDELSTPPNTPPNSHFSTSTPPMLIPRPQRSSTARISFAGSDHNSAPARAHTFDTLTGLSPRTTTRPPINRYPTPFPRISRPTVERSDSPTNYFNRSITTGSRMSHSDETVEGMLTLAQFAEHTSTLRNTSSTLPHTKVIKAPPLLDINDLQEDFGNESPTSPYSDKFDARTPEPISEMVERRKRDFFKPVMTLVPEDPAPAPVAVYQNPDQVTEETQKNVTVSGRRSCM